MPGLTRGHHSSSSSASLLTPSGSNSPHGAFGLPSHLYARHVSNGNKVNKPSVSAMTPISAQQSGSSGNSLPPLGQALSHTLAESTMLPPPMMKTGEASPTPEIAMGS
jgi:hypothetical protein